ncbi:U4/U6.U5 small nuclear ribonucleoprotein 27 kDa protein-like [Gigantopelta aegis]|uniref:U4/U6.U5 small nuclear ribonucleoprotein 27 kDa protein-like n=1 Tax=Gigantopelta aegis TaxID=1735272 RepID=UPI001B88B9EB|nr:U4/U6.U5 small nuclear ribonucleoprotein 27 kDa protein-like [Gigantopelta aegis]
MPRSRSRSRSPRRERRRSRSRERDRRHRDRHRRSRSRTPPTRHRSRSISPGSRKRSRSTSQKRHLSGKSAEKKLKSSSENLPKLDASQLADMTEDEIQMMQVMGFSGFTTTKGKKVDGNNIYEANISRKRRYRQYMNRRGGFNRPLDFIA